MIPFEIPDRLLGMIAIGAARRIGATIRDTTTGRILAHVQETDLLANLADANPGGLLLSGGQLASSIAANVQLEQVKRLLLGLRMLNAASLAASAAGLGVSVAGFALVLRRLGHLEAQLAAVGKDVVEARVVSERVEVRVVTRDRSRVESLLARAEEGWHRSDCIDVWRQLEGPLDMEQRYWQALVGGVKDASIFLDPRFTLEQAVAAYESALTLATCRGQTLLLIGEKQAALHQAQQLERWHERAMLALGSTEIAGAMARSRAGQTGQSEADARAELLDRANGFLNGAYEVQHALEGRPRLVQLLIDQGTDALEHVRRLRDADDGPVVLIPEVRG